LRPVIDQLEDRRDSWLKSYRVRILDGNLLKSAQLDRGGVGDRCASRRMWTKNHKHGERTITAKRAVNMPAIHF
jgi:hypothetical protein